MAGIKLYNTQPEEPEQRNMLRSDATTLFIWFQFLHAQPIISERRSRVRKQEAIKMVFLTFWLTSLIVIIAHQLQEKLGKQRSQAWDY